MTATDNLLKIAELEGTLRREEAVLAEREGLLTEDLLNGDNFTGRGERAQALAGLDVLKRLWPERRARLKARIFKLNSEIENL